MAETSGGVRPAKQVCRVISVLRQSKSGALPRSSLSR